MIQKHSNYQLIITQRFTLPIGQLTNVSLIEILYNRIAPQFSLVQAMFT